MFPGVEIEETSTGSGCGVQYIYMDRCIINWGTHHVKQEQRDEYMATRYSRRRAVLFCRATLAAQTADIKDDGSVVPWVTR